MTESPEDDSTNENQTYRDWPHNLSQLQDLGEQIVEHWQDENPYSSRDYPTVRWLNNNGYSHIRWILSSKHDMGTPEFFILFTPADGTEEYEWGINDAATIERANAYLADRVECRGWTDATKRTNRAQLNAVLRRFADKYGDDAVIALANDLAVRTDVYETFKEVGKDLRAELVSDDSAHHYLRSTHRFFEWLNRSYRIEYDPMEGIEEEFAWEWNTESTPLEGQQVKRLWIAAETAEERILVIGYCVWGVRTKELAAIHVDQLDWDPQDPTIVFSERDRKNGQGEVSLMFGLDALADLLDKRARQPGWNGHIMPSPKPDRSYLCKDQMRRRFKKLSKKAGVRINGDPATPKHGRAFYYNILTDAETDLLEAAEKIADEQGAVDPTAIRDSYLTEERRRRYRRVFFRQRIREVLPEDAYIGANEPADYDSSLGEFN